jgi:hypothetical protein
MTRRGFRSSFRVGPERKSSFCPPLLPTPRSAESEPFHVQVARALGWKDCDGSKASTPWEFTDPPEPRIVIGIGINPDGRRSPIPRYDTDWSATGPLIEHYGLHVGHSMIPHDPWIAGTEDSSTYGPKAHGPTPLIAACNLILALHKAGKLC